MEELSLHLLDLIQNSVKAGASLIEVYTGFIYNGHGCAKRICKRLKEEAVRKEHAAREAKAAESPDTRNTL